MINVQSLPNVYFEPKSKNYYKLKQKFENYCYYNCVIAKCPGRVRIDNKSNITLMNKHSKHDNLQNTIQLMKIKRMILEMASDPKYDGLKPAAIYENVMINFEGVLLPKYHKSIARKSVVNARRRKIGRLQSSRLSESYQKTKCNEGKNYLFQFFALNLDFNQILDISRTL